ncbi:phage protein GemA/Gp16 family protein [Pseudoroseicyclus sp. H15]
MSKSTLQRKVHLACRELGLDEDARHALQLRVTGKGSMRDMSEGDLAAVAKELEKAGFKPSSKGRRPPAPRADLRLIHVLWRMLGDAGVLTRPGRPGLNTFIRSRFEATWGSVPADIDMLRDHEKIAAVTQALRDMCRRHGIKVERRR